MTLSMDIRKKLIGVILLLFCHTHASGSSSDLQENNPTKVDNISVVAGEQKSCSNCYGYDCCYQYCCDFMCGYETTTDWYFTDTTPTPTTTRELTTITTTTGKPCLRDDNPKFSKPFYQSSLPSWPTAGTMVHLGLNATTSDNRPLRYHLVTSFEFLTLSAANDILFTNNVSDGAYVGPNNVMVIEVVAEVIGDESRNSSSTIIIVFPRSVTSPEDVPV